MLRTRPSCAKIGSQDSPRGPARARCRGALWLSLALTTGCRDAPAPSAQREQAPAKAKDAGKDPGPEIQDWEAEYRAVKAQTQDWNPVPGPQLTALESRLRAIVEHGQDPHLRANACILAASLHDALKDYPTALSYYRQAIALVPQEPSGYALAALALAAMKRFKEAVVMQQELVRRDPDDLQAWLMLGEMNVRAKQPEQAAKAYAAYETRRSGLLEGLTRKRQGAYVLGVEDRANCVLALAAAPDAGTSLALVHALQSDPDAVVRRAIIDVMADQRFEGYLKPLREWSGKEPDAGNKARIQKALTAIAADPVKTRPEPGDIARPSSGTTTPGQAPPNQPTAPSPQGKASPTQPSP